MILNYNIYTDGHVLCPIVSRIKIFYLRAVYFPSMEQPGLNPVLQECPSEV